MDHYDVIIIGTGAGGGTLVHRLGPSGKRILLLERGGYLPRELENWDSREVFGRERYVTAERWYDKHGVPFRPHAQYFVGGNTKVYGGARLAHLLRRPRALLRGGRAALPRPRPSRRGPHRTAALRAIPIPRRLP
jgi:choline dehydrogenase-like flavoprotein